MILKVIETTDSRFEGNKVEVDKIPFIDEIMSIGGIDIRVSYIKETGNRVEIGNPNYIIVFKKIGE
jgi:preprotein translocase subunit YajC